MTREQDGPGQKEGGRKPTVDRERRTALILAEPDPEDPTQRKHKVIDTALAEIVLADLLPPTMSPRQRAIRLANGVKNISVTRDRIVAGILNYPYLLGIPLKKMDRLLEDIRAINPRMEFSGPEDYAALFNQEVPGAKKPEEQVFSGDIHDPTAPPKYDPTAFRESDWNMGDFLRNLSRGRTPTGPFEKKAGASIPVPMPPLKK